MNVLEHIIVFSTIVLCSLLLSYSVFEFKIKIGDKYYYFLRKKNNLIEKSINGSNTWCMNYKNISSNNTTTGLCTLKTKSHPPVTIDIYECGEFSC